MADATGQVLFALVIAILTSLITIIFVYLGQKGTTGASLYYEENKPMIRKSGVIFCLTIAGSILFFGSLHLQLYSSLPKAGFEVVGLLIWGLAIIIAIAGR